MNGIFSNPDFFPTPQDIIFKMLAGIQTEGKTILEPSAGKGDIINVLLNAGANVLYCEQSEPLKKILDGKGRFLCADFLEVKSEDISHIHSIVMNPPFSKGAEHIIHAFNIAPAGCDIVALCNLSTVKNVFGSRKELVKIIETNGSWTDLGRCFDDAERKTNVEVAMIRLKKAGEDYKTEFEGFFMDEEEETNGSAGLISYDVVKDLVNRYVAAVKIYDEQLNAGLRMNNLLSSFYGQSLGFTCTEDNKPKLRNDFKKDLQRAGWKFIFNKLGIEKDITKGTREKINKFIEEQQTIPFTVKNIWQMLNIIVQTRSQTMDAALLEVFDRITERHHENRHNVKGWKTNLHYLVGKKFILPNQVRPEKEYGFKNSCYNSMNNSYDGIISDLEKALCYIEGKQYADVIKEKDFSNEVISKGIKTIHKSINRNYYGEWYESEFFKYKAYKNGNMHFEFIDLDLWGRFNQRIAKLKGFPLYEHKTETDYQRRNAGKPTEKKQKTETVEQEILFSINL